jgi:ZIP family zinc transporter
VSSAGITMLGFIAGVTILIGLPIGRVRNASQTLRAFLNATAVGILVFLLIDVLSHAQVPVDAALVAAKRNHTGTWASFVGLAALLLVGVAVGLMSLAYYERWMAARARGRAPHPSAGPGAMSTSERPTGLGLTATPARRLALLIAVGIGLHNFSEGLAIGQSAAGGEISLAVLLVIGFALHNATEGFGITAPLAADDSRPSWAMLGLLGLIGGGPTFLGTILGQSVASSSLYVGFLALAAGSILYVVVQLIGVAHKLGNRHVMYWGVLVGLTAGFLTDFIVTAAGT